MSQAQAVEVGFFQAMRDLGLSLKVAARLYDDTVELMVKSAAVRIPRGTARAPLVDRPPANVPNLGWEGGTKDAFNGMTDILGKPQYDYLRYANTPKPATPRPRYFDRVTGMEDSLRPAPLLSRVTDGAQDVYANARKAVNKHPSKAGIGATVLGTTGAAAVGTGTGLLGSKVLNLLRGDNAARN